MFSQYDIMTHIGVSKMKKKPGRPSKGMTLTKHNIEMAIKSTQSMGQAGLYMGVSKNTFKKYAKMYDLWNPRKDSKGIRKVGNVGSQLKHDLKAILEGRNPNPYREDTLLTKGIREGYIECKCNNCGQDYSHMDSQEKLPPLILDFLDRNPMNTHIDNLRALCFNCIYILAPTKKGWYRHRETPLGQALDDATPGIPEQDPREIPKDDNLSYIPFEDFQKTLK